MKRTVTLEGFKPTRMLNLNDGTPPTKWGRARVRDDQKAWKQSAWALARSMGRTPRTVGRAEVWIVFGTNRPNQRRDPHNFTPTVKYILDGLTEAKVWPDDSRNYVHTHEPEFTNEIRPDRYRIIIEWEEPDGQEDWLA